MAEEQGQVHWTTTMSALFLVGGACIGGGMLALPVATGVSGFFPSLVAMTVTWLAMTISGLLIIEASLWLGEGAHFISISSRFLGNLGKWVSWVLYLFICYASIVAYTAAGGFQINHVIEYFSGVTLSKAAGCLIFFTIFGVIIDLGTKIVGRVNSVLFIGMMVSYLGIVYLGVPEVKPHYLLFQNWSIAFLPIPLLLTSFSFQTLAPSLTPYLKRNRNALRTAVIGGTGIAFLVYLIWQFMILGIVPAEGARSLAEALSKGQPATFFLYGAVNGKWIAGFADFFAFFALVTSFLGMALGLFDFLADGLSITKQGWGKVKLGLLIAIPTLIFSIFYEQAFLIAMDLSGGFGDTILNGVMPVMIVWLGRYRDRLPGVRLVPGGKSVLVATALYFVISLSIEILVQCGILSSLFDVKESSLL